MEKFVEMLKDKGIVDKIQKVVDFMSVTEDNDEEIVTKGIKTIIAFEINKDRELEDAFFDESFDLALDKAVKMLDIKRKTNDNATDPMCLLLKGIVKNIKESVENLNAELKAEMDGDNDGK